MMEQEFVQVNGRNYPVRTLRQGGNNQYMHVRLTVGTDWQTGRQIQHDYTGRTAADVRDKIEASRCLSDRQLGLTEEKITLKSLAEAYFQAKDLCVKPNTALKHRSDFRNWVQAFFPGKEAAAIQPEEIRLWQERLRGAGKTEAFISDLFILFQCVMEYGVRKGVLHCNPCRYARIVRAESVPQSIPKERQILALLERLKDHPAGGLLAVTLLLGLRISEARGLSWKQIHWEDKTVCISQQAARERGILPYTKTGRIRTIRVPECALFCLRREAEKQQRQKRLVPLWENRMAFDVLPAIGTVPLAAVTQSDLERMIRRMREAGRSTGTVHNTLSLLRKLFDRAVQERLMKENAADALSCEPRLQEGPKAMTQAGEEQLLRAFHTTWWPELYVLSMIMGIPAREMLRIRVSDFLREKKELRIGRGATRRSRAEKSEHVYRMTDDAVRIMERAIAKMGERGKDGNAYIFSVWIDRPMGALSPADLRRIRKASGNPSFAWKDLHSQFAVRALALGVNPRVLKHYSGMPDYRRIAQFADACAKSRPAGTETWPNRILEEKSNG